MHDTTPPYINKPHLSTRRLSTKKAPKQMEETPIHIPPNQKSNLHIEKIHQTGKPTQ